MYIYIYVYIHVYMYIRACIHTYIYVCCWVCEQPQNQDGTQLKWLGPQVISPRLQAHLALSKGAASSPQVQDPVPQVRAPAQAPLQSDHDCLDRGSVWSHRRDGADGMGHDHQCYKTTGTRDEGCPL